MLEEITLILAPISISNFKAHNKNHIDRVSNYFALICNTNWRCGWKKNKSTHTHTTVYTTNSRSIPERRTVITCVQLGDIIYSNFSNTSIKLVFVTTLPPYNSLSQNMHFFFWLFRLNGCSVLALCWAAGVVFTLRTMFDAGNTMPLYLYMHYSFSHILIRCNAWRYI